MTTYRTFPPDLESLAQECRDTLLTDLTWAAHDNPGDHGGEAQGFFVTSSTLDGFAKPSKKTGDVSRAAHEKIASDLAYELGLPVPPVILWRREGTNNSEARHVSISLQPFTPIYPWKTAEKDAQIKHTIVDQIAHVAHAMRAFDTWVSNRDRKNPGNVLVCIDDTNGHHLVRVAYIDYAYSLSEVWEKGEDKIHEESLAPIYPSEVIDAPEPAIQMAHQISAVPDSLIEEVVGRIPDDFASQPRRVLIEQSLKTRRDRLSDMVEKSYGGTNAEPAN